MGNENESVWEVIGEARLGNTGDMPFAYRVGLADKPEIREVFTNRIIEPQKIQIKEVTLREFLERIEKAVKREIGKTAAMREGLVWMKERLIAAVHEGSMDCNEALDKIEQALKIAGPIRNCEIYKSRERARKAFEESMSNGEKETAKRYPMAAMDYFIDWLFEWAREKGR